MRRAILLTLLLGLAAPSGSQVSTISVYRDTDSDGSVVWTTCNGGPNALRQKRCEVKDRDGNVVFTTWHHYYVSAMHNCGTSC